MINKLKKYIPIAATLFLILFASCGENEPVSPEDRVLVQIGDETITVREFRYNYETGFGHLKTGDDWKRSYLGWMIKEKLLALEGYNLGFHESENVRSAEAQLLNELIIEELVNVEVKSKIKITEADIREAINKSKVSFKFRYWTESNPEKAAWIAQAMQERGYAEVSGELMANNPEWQIRPQDLETDYVSWMETPPEVMNAIEGLPIGEVSDPVEINGEYTIFQVLDVRRAGVLETEYKSKATQFEQVLYYRRVQAAVKQYVADLLTPKNIVTKGDSFAMLLRALQEWRRNAATQPGNFLLAVQRATADYPAMSRLHENFDKPLVTHNDGDIPIGEFLEGLNLSYIMEGSKDGKRTMKDVVNEAVALGIRDHFMRKEARSKALDKSPGIYKELSLWRDSWVYSETRQHFGQGISLSDSAVKAFFEENKNRYKIRKDDEPEFQLLASRARSDAIGIARNRYLVDKADSLATIYPVKIYEAILDTIRVNDSKKSRWSSLQLFKAGTSRFAHPYADPQWER